VLKVTRRGIIQAVYWVLVAFVFVAAVAPIDEGGPPGSDKLEHFAAFVVLMLGAGWVWPGQRLWKAGVLLILYGGVIELVQGLPIVGRDCDLMDWLTDFAAVAAGAVVLTLSRLRARRGADKPVA
jgi:hypothetical protein